VPILSEGAGFRVVWDGFAILHALSAAAGDEEGTAGTPCRNCLQVVGIWLLGEFKYTLLLPWLAGGFVAFLSSLNHFHLEMNEANEKVDASFVKIMSESTQNMSSGPIWDWMSGGLARHVEHHLFPTLPHWKLPRVTSDVRQLLKRHGIRHHEAGLLTVIKTSFLHLITQGWSLDDLAANGSSLSSKRPIVEEAYRRVRPKFE